MEMFWGVGRVWADIVMKKRGLGKVLCVWVGFSCAVCCVTMRRKIREEKRRGEEREMEPIKARGSPRALSIVPSSFESSIHQSCLYDAAIKVHAPLGTVRARSTFTLINYYVSKRRGRASTTRYTICLSTIGHRSDVSYHDAIKSKLQLWDERK